MSTNQHGKANTDREFASGESSTKLGDLTNNFRKIWSAFMTGEDTNQPSAEMRTTSTGFHDLSRLFTLPSVQPDPTDPPKENEKKNTPAISDPFTNLSARLAKNKQEVSARQDQPVSRDTIVTQAQNSSFRFLDLPGETRNSIYAMAVDKNMHSLGYFRVPSIARASKQLRDEFLAFFFAETEFDVHFTIRHSADGDYAGLVRLFDEQSLCYSEELDTPREPASDPLCLYPSVRDFIRRSGDSALFKNISFVVTSGLWDDDGDGNLTRYRLVDGGPCSMTFKVDAKFKTTVVISAVDTEEEALSHEFFVDSQMQPAKARVEEIAAREGFKGFTLSDIESVAECFASATALGARS